ncbi:MAG: hypothetical protein PHO64_08325 [Thiomonas sp.]|nr:hypothetical protein [Thiomonas sp.]
MPGFPAALGITRTTDLVALVPQSFLRGGTAAAEHGAGAFHAFALPVSTPGIAISQLWHPRLAVDPAHRWLRALTREICHQQEARQDD